MHKRITAYPFQKKGYFSLKLLCKQYGSLHKIDDWNYIVCKICMLKTKNRQWSIKCGVNEPWNGHKCHKTNFQPYRQVFGSFCAE